MCPRNIHPALWYWKMIRYSEGSSLPLISMITRNQWHNDPEPFFIHPAKCYFVMWTLGGCVIAVVHCCKCQRISRQFEGKQDRQQKKVLARKPQGRGSKKQDYGLLLCESHLAWSDKWVLLSPQLPAAAGITVPPVTVEFSSWLCNQAS